MFCATDGTCAPDVVLPTGADHTSIHVLLISRAYAQLADLADAWDKHMNMPPIKPKTIAHWSSDFFIHCTFNIVQTVITCKRFALQCIVDRHQQRAALYDTSEDSFFVTGC